MKTLIKCGAIGVNDLDMRGLSPLHVAIWENDFGFMHELLALGAKAGIEELKYTSHFKYDTFVFLINKFTKGGCSISANIDDLNIMRFLISKGLDVNIKDDRGQSLLHYLISEEKARLLIDNVVNINTKDLEGRTPLHNAVRYLNKGLLKVLLDSGADTTIVDNQGFTPLQYVDIEKPKFAHGEDFEEIRKLLTPFVAITEVKVCKHCGK